MKKIPACLLLLVFLCIWQSCFYSSANQVEKINTPDREIIKNFGIETTGQIIFQFYQLYGFTDLEEQLILITKLPDIDSLNSELPISAASIKKAQRIDFRKFKKDNPINFLPEKKLQSDIQLEAKEYDSGENKNVFSENGFYKILQTDFQETVYVYDKRSNLMYVESKKIRK